EGADVARLVGEGDELEVPVAEVQKLRRAVFQQGAVLEGASAGFELEGLGAAEKVVPSQLQDSPRGEGQGGGRGAVGTVQGLDFEAGAVAQGEALALLDVDQHGLFAFVALGIFRGDGHVVEDAEIVEFALGGDNVAFAQGRLGFQLDSPANDLEAGVFVAVHENFRNGEARALGNLVG